MADNNIWKLIEPASPGSTKRYSGTAQVAASKAFTIYCRDHHVEENERVVICLKKESTGAVVAYTCRRKKLENSPINENDDELNFEKDPQND